MAGIQEQAVYTFSTTAGGATYQYDIIVDSQGLISARNFRTPLGLIVDPYTTLPAMVLEDVYNAQDQITQRATTAEVSSGTLTWAGETTLPIVIAGGVLNNTNYRVVYTTPDGTPLQTTGKTITGCTAEAPAAYGTALVPISVPYTVLVATASVSTYGGTTTILAADSGAVTITFPVAMVTENYRVVLTPNGIFPVYISAQTKASFTIQVGYTMVALSSVTVGYDVFV